MKKSEIRQEIPGVEECYPVNLMRVVLNTNTAPMINNPQKGVLKKNIEREMEIREKEAYQRGLDDAWEAARKSVHWWKDNEEGVKVFKELFDSWAVDDLFEFSASEAIAKIRKYEQDHATDCNNCKHKDDQFSVCSGCHRRYYCEASPDSCIHAKIAQAEPEKVDDEIRVGDEVYLLDERYPRVVTCLTKTNGKIEAIQLTQSGKWVEDYVTALHKTGRHFDQIEEVLKSLKEGKYDDR